MINRAIHLAIPLSFSVLHLMIFGQSGALANVSEFVVRQPIMIRTGRADYVQREAMRLGVRDVLDIRLNQSNRLIASFFQDLRLLEKQRNQIAADIRRSGKPNKLAGAFLNKIFAGNAFNANQSSWNTGYDSDFVKKLAQLNDLDSIEEWKVIRNLLEAGELPQLDLTKLKHRNTNRPRGFDVEYQKYIDAAERILEPLHQFDKKLPEVVQGLQQKHAQSVAAAFPDNHQLLSQATREEMLALFSGLSGPELQDLIIRSFTKSDGLNGSEPSTPIGPDLSAFPLKDPQGLPPLPTTRCRAVILRLPYAAPSETHPVAGRLAADDYPDLVAFGDRMRDKSLLVIRETGVPVYWSKEGDKFEALQGGAMKAFNVRFPASVLWVDRGGRIRYNSCDDPLIKRQLDALSDVVYIKMMYDTLFAITRDCKRHFLGMNVEDDKNRSLFIDYVNSTARVGFEVPWYFHIALKDGSKITFNGGRLEKNGPGTAKGFLNRAMIRPNNSLTCFAALYRYSAEINRRSPVQKLSSAGGNGSIQIVAIKTAPRSWELYKGENGKLTLFQGYHELIKNAVEVQVNSLDFLYVLYPADLVSRSGLWEVDDLKKEFGL